MTDFRAKSTPRVPGRAIQLVEQPTPAASRGVEARRGERVNSRIPISIEWKAGGEVIRKEAQTRVVGPYGCMAVLPMNLEVRQAIQLTNMVSRQSNAGVVVWRGLERPDGWELGIELINPQMNFWELDL